MMLTEIKSMHITEYFADKIELSHSFFKRSKFLIKAAFEAAIDNDFCIKNPVKSAQIAKKPVPPKKPVFTEDEMETILEFAKTDEWFGLPIITMYNTATRAQEVRAMTVGQFDFSNEIGILTVDRAIKRNGELGLTKSNEARPVPLAPEVTEFIREKTAGMTKYILGDDHYVSKAGFEARYNHFFNRLNKWLESQGQKPIVKKSPHSLRRTRATFWHKNGMPLAMVSALLGHSSLEVTARYIGLSDTESLAEAVVKFGDSVREAKKRGELLPTILQDIPDEPR